MEVQNPIGQRAPCLEVVQEKQPTADSGLPAEALAWRPAGYTPAQALLGQQHLAQVREVPALDYFSPISNIYLLKSKLNVYNLGSLFSTYMRCFFLFCFVFN